MNVARLSAVDQKNSLARIKFLSRDSDLLRTARNVLFSATKRKGGDTAVREIPDLIPTSKART